MRNKLIPVIISASLMLFSSCVDLTESPESSEVTSNFYRNEAEAEAAIDAVYSGLAKNGSETLVLYHGLIQVTTDMATDDYEAGTNASNSHVRAISNDVFDASNNRIEEIWRETYDEINRANIAIDKIAEIPSDKIAESKRLRFINEAKFIRGLNYFNLVRWFGEVPIILHETTSLTSDKLYVSQSTEDEVYEQVISDLKDAENLPAKSSYSDSDIGRATSGAAKALLSKVYLTRQEWQQAAEKAKEVIDSGEYDLFEDFADVFSLDHKNGKEHIFSVTFKGNANYQGNILAFRSAANDVPGINGNYTDALHIKGGLYESYDKNDKRLPVTFVSELVSPTDGKTYTLSVPHFNKYYDETVIGNQGQSSKDYPLLRYAEVLLIYAEAINELNGPTAAAYEAIDKVRSRAGISKLADIAPNLSKDEFRDSVFQERRKELAYEQKRWFDLARRGGDYFEKTLHAAGKANAQARMVHFPIPQREIDLNPNLKQNPDWVINN